MVERVLHTSNSTTFHPYNLGAQKDGSMRRGKIKVKTADLRRGQRIFGGEVITEVRWPFVATTAQRQVDEIEAATFAYLIEGKETDEFILLKKHPVIKGRKAVKWQR